MFDWLKKVFCWHDTDIFTTSLPWAFRFKCKKCKMEWYEHCGRGKK